MKKIAIIAALALTAACTTEEMLSHAHNECALIGYDPTTIQYTECVERQFGTVKATQNAAVAATMTGAITGGILGAMY